MPIYSYRCKKCGGTITAQIGLDEEPTSCSDVSLCDEGGEVEKLLSRPNIKKSIQVSGNREAGELTKEFIEENRKVLNQEKEGLSGRIYEGE